MEETSQPDLIEAMEALLAQPVKLTRLDGRIVDGDLRTGEWYVLFWSTIAPVEYPAGGRLVVTKNFTRYAETFARLREARRTSRNGFVLRKPIASERERGKPAGRVERRGERRRINAR